MDVRADPDLGVVAGDVAEEGAWQRHAAGLRPGGPHGGDRLDARRPRTRSGAVNVLGTRRALDAARDGGSEAVRSPFVDHRLLVRVSRTA